jgi:hypothetical protein
LAMSFGLWVAFLLVSLVGEELRVGKPALLSGGFGACILLLELDISVNHVQSSG